MSGKVRGDPKTPGRPKGAVKVPVPDKKAKKQRSSDLGRALRSMTTRCARPCPTSFSIFSGSSADPSMIRGVDC